MSERIDSYIDLGAIKRETDSFIEQMARLKVVKDEIKQIKDLLNSASSNKQTIDAVGALVKVEETANKVLADTAKVVATVENANKSNAKATKDAAAETEKLTGAYDRLKKQFSDADKEAKNLAAEFGVTSEQAIKAAESAATLKAQLNEINALSKTGGQPKVEEIPFTHNLNDDGSVKQPDLTNQTEAVNELNKAEAELTNTATAMGKANVKAGEGISGVSSLVGNVKGEFDQYTGSMRENILAQIENSKSLQSNKAAQKAINDAIKESGFATEGQTARLAALKEEAIVLDKTNKSLSTTIGNQAKEFIASAGSLEEGRAQVNLLQQSYAKLTEQERNQPYGLELKKNLDALEPKVKELEATMGLFSRNVGNYPKNFTGAFTVLEKELDSLKGKLSSGNLSGKEFDDLSKKTGVLNQVTQTLNTTFKTTAAEQNAYKEAAKQVGSTFGTNSTTFKNFAKEVADGSSKLKETNKALGDLEGGGNKAAGVFQKIFSGLRNIANVVPGLGLSGLILLLITPLSALATSLYEYATKATGAAKTTEDLKKQMEDMNAAVHESQNEFVKAVSSVESLKINIDLAKQGLLDKSKVLKEYNDTLGKTTGEVKTLDEAEQALVKNGDAYVKMMLYKAAANIALEGAAKKAFEAEEKRRKEAEKFLTTSDAITEEAARSSIVGPGNAFVGTDQIEQNEKEANALRARLAKQRKDAAVKESEDAAQAQLDIAKKFQHDAADIANNFNFDFFGGKEDGKKKTAIKHVKDFTDIVAELRKELSTLANEEAIGQITPKEADIKRVEAYQKAFKGLFDLKATASTPIVKQLQVELDPISQRVLEAQIHDLVSKIKPDNTVIQPPVIDNKAQRDLIIKNTSDQIKKISDLNDEGYVHDLENLRSYLDTDFITQDEYNKRLEFLQKQHARSELDNSIALNEAIIDNLKARSDGSKEATDQIAGYERTLNELKQKLYTADTKNNEEANKKKQRDDEKYAKAKADLGKLEVDLAKDAAALLETLVTASIENQIRSVEALEAAQQKNYDQQVQRINDSTLTEEQKAERLKILEAQRQAQKDQNDAKERDLNIKKAKFERLQSVATIIASTASAEVQALTYLSNPITAPLYPGIAAVIAAIGAIQLATLLATPLPKYKDGTESHKGGAFIWGEEGTELAIEPSGENLFFTRSGYVRLCAGRNPDYS
jgi:DNA repair exonuclease SbcCD ATPase subunit